MCAECDKYGRPMNEYCRSVANTESFNQAIEEARKRIEEREKENGTD